MRYEALYEHTLFYLTRTLGLLRIAEEDIKGMIINNYNANRNNLGTSDGAVQ